jgi:hypothetical protein
MLRTGNWRALVLAAMQSRDGFEPLARALQDPLHAIVLRACRRNPERCADDIIQEIHLHLYLRIYHERRVDVTRTDAQILGYLMLMARMRLLDVLRGEPDEVPMDDVPEVERPAHSTRAHAIHEEPMLAEWERALRVSGDMAVAKLVLAKRHGVSRRSMAAKLRWTAAQHREKENAI